MKSFNLYNFLYYKINIYSGFLSFFTLGYMWKNEFMNSIIILSTFELLNFASINRYYKIKPLIGNNLFIYIFLFVILICINYLYFKFKDRYSKIIDYYKVVININKRFLLSSIIYIYLTGTLFAFFMTF
jgi:hypothetical protein